MWEYVPRNWQEPLQPVKSTIRHISTQLDFLKGQSPQFLPAAIDVFRALQIAPEQVRVVVVGQDPYPNPAYACGLSFSVPADITVLPGSLKNILREVALDVGNTQIVNGDLQPWVDQGVMLLNRTLTVAPGQPASHQSLGWSVVTDCIIDVVTKQNPEVIAVLWGKQAQELVTRFKPDSVITGVHPSPLSAHRGFFGSAPFSAVNAKLNNRQQQPIRW